MKQIHFRRVLLMHFLSRTAAALALSGACFLAGSGSALAAQTASLSVDATPSESSASISPLLYGIFLEDINFAVDGGMYAELIKNGSFEYGMLAKNSGKHNYSLSDKSAVTLEVVDGSADGTCLNENNPHYGVITNASDAPEGIGNKGYLKGFAIEEGKSYTFSAFLKGLDGYTGDVDISIADKEGTVLAETTISNPSDGWMKYTATLTATASSDNLPRLWIKIGNGKVAVDMISLVPSETYKNRKNGIRKDVGEYLEALQPKFLRFPGGCAIEGTAVANQYSWKASIGYGLTTTINGEEVTGDVSARPLGVDIWHTSTTNPYYMTYGLGFYEYFLLCEDLDCLPVPVVNAGMVCPIHAGTGYTYFSEDSEEFQAYVQDALDLVEFCRGGADTKWGAIRIAMGHEAPFDLHYIGIGNEQWQDEYYSHYERFKEAFAKAAEENPELYGDIELIVANGPASTDRFAWEQIAKNGTDYAGAVDEHYYEQPEWFLANTDRYDSYDRDSVPVFLGEYAAKSNTMQAALAEAAYMTGLERNGDIVKMACYAPLFGNDGANQWEPDMIFLSKYGLYGTVNYYAQKLFMNHPGTTLLASECSDADGIYQVASIDDEGNRILKLVNTSADDCSLTVTMEHSDACAPEATVSVLKADSPDDKNSFSDPEHIVPKESSLAVGSEFSYELPAYSINVIVIPAAQ